MTTRPDDSGTSPKGGHRPDRGPDLELARWENEGGPDGRRSQRRDDLAAVNERAGRSPDSITSESGIGQG